MLRGRYYNGGFWFVVRLGSTRFRLDWMQPFIYDDRTDIRTSVKCWSVYSTEPVKFHLDKSWKLASYPSSE